jgi:DNA-binding FadR family transcriptional regulator
MPKLTSRCASPLAAERKLSRRLFEQLAEQIKSGRLAPGARCRPSRR